MTELKEQIRFSTPVPVKIGEAKTEPMYSTSSTIYAADATTRDQMYLVESCGVLEFWNDPAEDVYSEGDDGV